MPNYGNRDSPFQLIQVASYQKLLKAIPCHHFKRIEQPEHYAKVLPIKVSGDMENLEETLTKEIFFNKYSKGFDVQQ